MQWAIQEQNLSSQQELVMDTLLQNLERPQWLRGFAGSGKTVLMTLLAERLCAIDRNASICFISYTHALTDLVRTGFHVHSSNRVHVMTYHKFLNQNSPYTYVFVDEVQDIPIERLEKIRNLARHLLVAGDPDQRIYKVDFTEERIIDLLNPKISKLDEVFRLTQTLLDVAVSIYTPAKDSAHGVDVVGGKDSSVKLASCSSSLIESAWIWEQANELAAPGRPSVVLLPSHEAIGNFSREIAKHLELPEPDGAQRNGRGKCYPDFNNFWRNHNVPMIYLGNGFGSLTASDGKPIVYLMTLHSAKGLDFDNVFLPKMAQNNFIWGKEGSDEDAEILRRLLFVAVTRSRSNLFISFSGRREHDTIMNLPKQLITELTIDSVAADNDEDEDEEWF